MNNDKNIDLADSSDFSACLRFRPESVGGRSRSIYQGYRPAISYESDLAHAWMVFTVFVDDVGVPIASGVPIPEVVRVFMQILSEEFRRTIHRRTLHEGTPFFVTDGRQIVADGIVERIIRLHEDRGEI